MRKSIALKLSLSRALLPAVAAIAALAGLTVLSVASSTGIGEGRSLRPQAAQLQGPQTAPAKIPTAPQGYRVGEIRVTGAKFLRSEFLQSSLGLVSGEVFSESRLRQGFEDLRKLYGSLGYVNFLPEPVFDLDEQKKVVNLTVNIDEGRQFFVNRITFTGNTTIPDDVIRREISVKEGYVFNASLLDFALLRLNRLGFFEEIKVEDFWIKPSADEPKLDIELRVKEKRR